MNPWIVLPVLAILAALFVAVPVALAVYARYAGLKSVRCPLAQREAIVEVDAARAGLGALFGRRTLRLVGCSLLPERWGCARACLADDGAALHDTPQAG
jgi:hypothetical protein